MSSAPGLSCRRLKMKILLCVVLAGVLSLAGAQTCNCSVGSMPCGTQAPAFKDVRLPTLAGDTCELGTWVGSTPVVLVWFKSGPDVDSSARIVREVATAHPEVVFLAALSDTGSAFRSRVKRLKLDFPVLLDPGRHALSLAPELGHPSLVFIGASGEIAWTHSLIIPSAFEQGLASITGEDMVTDPVCLMKISKATAAGTWTHEGTAYYFCHVNCLKLFKQNPGKYVAQSPKR
jgi:YHS domain-containing protein